MRYMVSRRFSCLASIRAITSMCSSSPIRAACAGAARRAGTRRPSCSCRPRRGSDNTVQRIAPAGAGAVTDTIPLGNGPAPIAAGDGAIWVANSRDDTVSRIDPATRSPKAEIPVGRLPSGIAVGAGAVWVANSLSGTVSRIDPRMNRVTTTIDVGGEPHSLAVAGGRVWVSVQEAPPRPASAGGPSVARVLLERDPGTTNPA